MDASRRWRRWGLVSEAGLPAIRADGVLAGFVETSLGKVSGLDDLVLQRARTFGTSKPVTPRSRGTRGYGNTVLCGSLSGWWAPSSTPTVSSRGPAPA